ncbi:MAG: carboxylesterase family protein, partial [Pseudomonadota bacterium]|nr:carboxylesterase family protein [Pseudomonadota bacterium]
MQNPLSIYHLIMNKLPKWGFLIFVSCLLLSCASNQNKTIEIRSDQAALRTISAGNVIGYSHDNNTFAWLGIPYAKPPVGDLRWKAPRELEPWQ